MVLVGYFYDTGVGVRTNRTKALQWYRRAHRAHDGGGAANNIGVILRQRGQLESARRWFARAMALGNDDAALQYAEVLLLKRQVRRASKILSGIIARNQATEDTLSKSRWLMNSLGPSKAALKSRRSRRAKRPSHAR